MGRLTQRISHRSQCADISKIARICERTFNVSSRRRQPLDRAGCAREPKLCGRADRPEGGAAHGASEDRLQAEMESPAPAQRWPVPCCGRTEPDAARLQLSDDVIQRSLVSAQAHRSPGTLQFESLRNATGQCAAEFPDHGVFAHLLSLDEQDNVYHLLVPLLLLPPVRG